MNELSRSAKCLWAKKSKDGFLQWLPLIIHLADCSEVARKLWNYWLPEGVKYNIKMGLTNKAQNTADLPLDELAEMFFVFLAAAHDLGKATPVFQAKESSFPTNELDKEILSAQIAAGLPMFEEGSSRFQAASKTPHALATLMLLEEAGCNTDATAILGAHHGKPAGAAMLVLQGINSYPLNYHLGRKGENSWRMVQHEIIDFSLKLAGFQLLKDVPIPNMAAQVLLSGLVIMTDWIASNELLFPYFDFYSPLEGKLELTALKERGKQGWERLKLPDSWRANMDWLQEDHYQHRFETDTAVFFPRPMQKAVLEISRAIIQPGIMVVEAPMGQGKTEAALVAAEIFAHKADRSGLFFALPTQATSDAMFSRIERWAQKLDVHGKHSIRLAHGKSQFNRAYKGLEYQKMFEGSTNVEIGESENLVVHQWFEGQKKSLLADFVVGTIDQLLMAALKQKHVMLRHLGLAGKVVIIDECHAYDAYMNEYLEMVLQWLGAYKVPVIVLSATLPAEKRQMLVEAYLNRKICNKIEEQENEWTKSRGYPIITWSNGEDVNFKTLPSDGVTSKIKLGSIIQENIVERLEELLIEGGCAGIILNTVKDAQAMMCLLRERFKDEVILLHSRFLASQRAALEVELLTNLGKPGPESKRPYRQIVVGTQVLEQSLDIDFDVMITDLCPMDLLLQRIGRLHRHERNRPKLLQQALCFIRNLDQAEFDSGTKSIYSEYLLIRTKALLPSLLTLPEDIPRLVQDVYDENVKLPQEPPDYHAAQMKHRSLINEKQQRAKAYRIDPIWLDDPYQNLTGWLDTNVSDKKGEAAVRDTDESMEVLMIQQKSNGQLHFLPWEEDGGELNPTTTPSDKQARALARQRLRLPRVLCGPWIIDETIAQLERVNKECLAAWQLSPWLTGELFMILNADFKTVLSGYRIVYDQHLGLIYEKEEESDARDGV